MAYWHEVCTLYTIYYHASTVYVAFVLVGGQVSKVSAGFKHAFFIFAGLGELYLTRLVPLHKWVEHKLKCEVTCSTTVDICLKLCLKLRLKLCLKLLKQIDSMLLFICSVKLIRDDIKMWEGQQSGTQAVRWALVFLQVSDGFNTSGYDTSHLDTTVIRSRFDTNLKSIWY